MRHHALPCVLALSLLMPLPTEARSKQRQYRWAELEARIKNRNVSFVLPDGTYVQGKVLGVEPDNLRLKVNETSNAAVQSKGESLIPARSLSVLRVMETGKKWRIICTPAVPIVVVAAIARIAGSLPESGASGENAVAAGVGAAFAGGYFLGWALDRKTTEIEIIHE